MSGEVRDVSTIVRELDERFAFDEMIPATDLQEKSVSKLLERVSTSHKLLLTHYNKPFGVLLDVAVFSALVRHLRELEARVEDLEAGNFIDRRLAKGLPLEKWLDEDQFTEAAVRVLDQTPAAEADE